MKKLVNIFTILLLTTIVSCSSNNSAKISSDSNPDVDTSSYKTFAWLTPSQVIAAPSGFNPIIKSKISNAIESALEQKGFRLVSSATEADFSISYSVGSRDKIKVNSYPASYGHFSWGRGYYGGDYGGGMPVQTSVHNYTEGKLAIDIYDVNSKQPAWHGWATKKLSKKTNENQDQLIKEVVERMFTSFNR